MSVEETTRDRIIRRVHRRACEAASRGHVSNAAPERPDIDGHVVPTESLEAHLAQQE